MRSSSVLRVVLPFVATLGSVHSQPVGGTITRIAGCGTCAFTPDGQPALASRLYQPEQVAVDSTGAVYFVESGSPNLRDAAGRIRKLTVDGKVVAVAGTGYQGETPDGGLAVNAALTSPYGVAVEASGNVYFSEWGVGIRKVTRDGVLHTVTTDVRDSLSLAVDGTGTLYACTSSGQVFKITSAGAATVLAGTGERGFGGDLGPAAKALLAAPNAVAADAAGNVYISDHGNNRIRMVTLDGIINTVAGDGSRGFGTGDGGPAVAASITDPNGIVIDGLGNLYISEAVVKVRKVTPAGIISTVVGRDSHDYYEREAAEFCCSGLLATSAHVENLLGLATDTTNNLYLVSSANENMILKVTSETYAAGAPPKLAAVANAADYNPVISPTAWITVTGTALAPLTRSWADADFAQGAAPQQLNGIRVYVDGWPTLVSFISPTQINAMVFHGWDWTTRQAGHPVLVEVITPQGRSGPLQINYDICAPGIFRLPVDGGKWPVAQAYSDGALIGPPGILPGVFTRPARAGDMLTVYGTGYGKTDPAVPADNIGATPAPLATSAWFNTDFVRVTPNWAGRIGLGLYQFNFAVPPGIPDGEYMMRPQACGGMLGSAGYLIVKQ